MRKSLRLLIDDNPEALEELENDISYVYSGYAPISVRLVQCVAQKNGVISNPAEKASVDDRDRKGKGSTSKQLFAHPIVGWKGFDDVLSIIPGKTFDIVQKMPSGTGQEASSISAIRKCGHLRPLITSITWASTWFPVQPHEQPTTTVVFFLGGCTYTEIAALRWVSRQNKGTD